jgi:hypothetical protein
MRESDIVHENGDYWVLSDKSGYLVMMAGITHSKTLCTFPKTDDGRSLAIAYCEYRAKHDRRTWHTPDIVTNPPE